MRFSLIAVSALVLATTGVVGLKKGDLGPDAFPSTGSFSEVVSDTALNRSARLPAAQKPVETAQSQVLPLTGDLAQAQPAAEPAPPPASDAVQVDESALRYFASRGDTTRLQAEISRLRALYPTWTPPENPLAIPRNTERQLENMWQLYSQARYPDVRKAIADRQASDPAWQPPADLLERLTVAEARAELLRASDDKRYDSVVQLAAETPSLLTCSEVDVLWRVAEAFARTLKPERARDAYLYILNNCDNPAERLATVQKAVPLLPFDMVENLLDREKTGADGVPEFESIKDDLSRNLVIEADKNPDLVVPPKYLTRLEKLAETSGLPSDSLPLGWYYLRRNNMPVAEQWFRRARAKEDSASAAQGIALALIDRQAPGEAEEIMYPWRSSSPDAKAVYLAATANLLGLEPPVEIKTDVLRRIVPEVMKARDEASAQQFGWYARALKQFTTAAQWFETALRWKSDDEASAYGLALTRHDLGDEAGVAEIQGLWAGRSERIARLGEPEQKTPAGKTSRLPGPAGRTVGPVTVPDDARETATDRPVVNVDYVRRQPRTAAPARAANKGCWTTRDPQALPPADALIRGWCLMEINRPLEAAAAFDVALSGGNDAIRQDAAYGKSLAYLRVGLADKAAVAATQARQSPSRIIELQTAILSDRALVAFKGRRYREALLLLDQRAQIAPEQTDLMVLRGYSYMNLRRFADAKRVFTAVANTGSRDGMRGLADLREVQKSFLSPG